MERELGRGLRTNAHLTTSGGFGFGRGPLGGGFNPGVGRGYKTDMAGSDWLGWLGYRFSFFILINLAKGPRRLAKPRHTPRTCHSPAGELELHMSTHAPNPRLTIPYGLTKQTHA
ncbi:hypothetical protein Hanom_Chr03g00198711 [Helianthus anomalus]